MLRRKQCQQFIHMPKSGSFAERFLHLLVLGYKKVLHVEFSGFAGKKADLIDRLDLAGEADLSEYDRLIRKRFLKIA